VEAHELERLRRSIAGATRIVGCAAHQRVGDAAFHQYAATGAAMVPADAVEYARHHIQLARRQAADTNFGHT
jgi:hypothetical protein